MPISLELTAELKQGEQEGEIRQERGIHPFALFNTRRDAPLASITELKNKEFTCPYHTDQ